jgi:hypothetical protein
VLAIATHLAWRSRLELSVLIFVASMFAAIASLWVWNAIMIPRWWGWAVQTGVDPDRLVTLATKTLLISEKDPWWREQLRRAD